MTVAVDEKFELSVEVKTEIDHWLTKYPDEHKRSAIVAALLATQEQNGGWLSQAAMTAVADYLKLPAMDVYELATFYDMFELAPIGKHKIGVCTNIACQLRGVDKIVSHLKDRLGVGLGETTTDGQFTLRETECLAACGGAPMCQVNDREYIEDLTPEKIDALLDKLSRGGDANGK